MGLELDHVIPVSRGGTDVGVNNAAGIVGRVSSLRVGCGDLCFAGAASSHLGAARLEIDDGRAGRCDPRSRSVGGHCTAFGTRFADEHRRGDIRVSRDALADRPLGAWRDRPRRSTFRRFESRRGFVENGACNV